MEGCQAIGLIKIIQGMLQRRGKNGARVSESGSEKGVVKTEGIWIKIDFRQKRSFKMKGMVNVSKTIRQIKTELYLLLCQVDHCWWHYRKNFSSVKHRSQIQASTGVKV